MINEIAKEINKLVKITIPNLKVEDELKFLKINDNLCKILEKHNNEPDYKELKFEKDKYYNLFVSMKNENEEFRKFEAMWEQLKELNKNEIWNDSNYLCNKLKKYMQEIEQNIKKED